MKKNDKKIRSAYATLTGIRRAVPILLFALSIFFALCFIAPGGVGLGKYIASFFKGLFSIGGFFIPPLLAIHAIFYAQDYQKKSGFARMIFSVILLFCFSAFLHAIKALNTELAFAPLEFYRAGKELSGGGFFGGILGYVLIKLFGPVGLIIVAALFFALYITYFFANGKSTLAKILLFILDRISDFANKFSKKKKAERLEKKKRAEARRIEAKAPKISAKHSDLYEDEFFSVNNGLSELRIEELGISEKRDPKEMELFPKLQDKVLKEMTDESEMKLEKEEASKSAPVENIVIPESKPDIPREFSDSADSIFTKEFDPFDFNQNAALAEKQASVAKKTAPTISEYVEAKKSFTEKEINEARLRDFEARREAFLKAEARKREIAEEEEKKRKLSEILREPEPERATYTSYAESYAAKTLPNEDSADEIFEVEVNPKEDVPYTIKDNTLFEEADTDAESSFATLPDEEEETLKIERENVFDSFASNEDEEEEYEEDEDGFEVSFGEEEEEEEPDFDEPIPEELRNPDVIAYRERFAFLREEEKPMPEANVITDSESLIEDIPEEYLEKEKTGEDAAEEAGEDAYVPFEISKEKAEPTKEEKREYKAPSYPNYKNPPLDLLKRGLVELDENLNEEISANGEKLIETLSEFNVRASIRSVDIGPRITRYEIVPAKGVRVNSVINLFDDIALSLAAEGIRMEAPIPGKSAIGVEIPNKKPQMVYLRDLLETDEFKNSESTTMACFGKDVTGNVVLGDIAKMPHMLIAGATGMGKSVCINSLMISMLYRSRPDELKFIMIDPKMVEFNGYNGIPHLLIPVIIDVKQAAGALMWAVEQMEKRYELFLKYNVRNLDGYNAKLKENSELGEPLPKIVIVIDELNDLMLQARKPVEDLIMRIAQKARAAGIHLIIGTQRPSVDVITGVIKANIPARIACKVASFTDSKTILEQAGAEKLLNNGDMLFLTAGKPKPTRVQGAFVSDGEVEAVMNFLKSQSKGENYDEKALEEINRAAQKCAKGGKDDDDDDDGGEAGQGIFNDPQFLEAVELAVKQGKIATSLIQRKIGVGYGRAAKFIDFMESQGFVSEPNGQKPREVLITLDEWHEILSRRSLD